MRARIDFYLSTSSPQYFLHSNTHTHTQQVWGPGHRTPLVIIPNAAPARSFWRERFSVVSGKSAAATHRDRVRLDIQITQQIWGKQRQHATISIFDTKTTHTTKTGANIQITLGHHHSNLSNLGQTKAVRKAQRQRTNITRQSSGVTRSPPLTESTRPKHGNHTSHPGPRWWRRCAPGNYTPWEFFDSEPMTPSSIECGRIVAARSACTSRMT